jgi:hypothetical protein
MLCQLQLLFIKLSFSMLYRSGINFLSGPAAGVAKNYAAPQHWWNHSAALIWIKHFHKIRLRKTQEIKSTIKKLEIFSCCPHLKCLLIWIVLCYVVVPNTDEPVRILVLFVETVSRRHQHPVNTDNLIVQEHTDSSMCPCTFRWNSEPLRIAPCKQGQLNSTRTWTNQAVSLYVSLKRWATENSNL